MVDDTHPPEPRATTILIIEDEFIFFFDAEEALIANGYRVIGPAKTVESALELLDRERPDLVLLDVNLRGEWSTPVARELRAAGIPFLVTSSYSSKELEPLGLLDGGQYIGKPVEEDRLIRAVSAMAKRA